jgi:DNA-directed RNA polymerase specialized sigma54-like protein
MTLMQMAEALAVHESTVSRDGSEKNIETLHSIIEMIHFHLRNRDGQGSGRFRDERQGYGGGDVQRRKPWQTST